MSQNTEALVNNSIWQPICQFMLFF